MTCQELEEKIKKELPNLDKSQLEMVYRFIANIQR